MRTVTMLGAAAALLALAAPAAADIKRNFAGSIQIDYLHIATEDIGHRQALDGATAEISLKLAVDFDDDVTANVKVCVACHGLEVGMAYFDVRVADALTFRVGRFIPAFGDFPVRHDPANHRTSDKPLPYDMGRMLRLRELNLGILPAPWVDNGLQVSGTVFFGEHSQFDYAAYAVSGPKAGAGALDFDFVQSRTPASYYLDNNSRPSVGGRLATILGFSDETSLSLGASTFAGTYDPDNDLRFLIVGGDLVFRTMGAFLRAEYLARWTEMSLGTDPASTFRYGPGPDGKFDDVFLKEGWYVEGEVPAGPFDFVLRWDGLRRRGNVPITSPLRSDSVALRYTAATALRISGALRLKLSAEYCDFSDFEDEVVVHLGLAGPF